MNKKYVAISATVISLLLVAYGILHQPIGEIGDGEGKLVLQGDVKFIVGDAVYSFGNLDVSPPLIIISDTYLIVGNITYGYSNYTYALMVNNSWNLISWPTCETISKANIAVIYNNTVYTWDEACDGIIIAPFVYFYDGLTYVQTDYFYPYFGYWLYSHHDMVVLAYGG